MAQCVVEHKIYDGKYLSRIDHDRQGKYACQTNSFKPGLEEALVLDKKDALAFARRHGGRVWQVRGGQPDELIWPVEVPQT